MSERLQGHRTKLYANKMTCDGRVHFWVHAIPLELDISDFVCSLNVNSTTIKLIRVKTPQYWGGCIEGHVTCYFFGSKY